MKTRGNSDDLTSIEIIELEDLYRELLDEQADIRRLEQRLAKVMTEAAFREFPTLKYMSAEQLRHFGDRVSRTADEFAMKAANIAFQIEQGK